MTIQIKHTKTNNIPDPTQADVNAQIALGNLPAGTVLADLTLHSDWNAALTTSMATGKLLGRSTATTGSFEEITPSTGLSLSGSNLTVTGAPPTGSAGGDLTGTYPNPPIANNAVTNDKFRQSAALSIVGRSANSTGNVADISTNSGSNGVLREFGGALDFGSISYTMVTGLGDLSTQDTPGSDKDMIFNLAGVLGADDRFQYDNGQGFPALNFLGGNNYTNKGPLTVNGYDGDDDHPAITAYANGGAAHIMDFRAYNDNIRTYFGAGGDLNIIGADNSYPTQQATAASFNPVTGQGIPTVIMRGASSGESALELRDNSNAWTYRFEDNALNAPNIAANFLSLITSANVDAANVYSSGDISGATLFLNAKSVTNPTTNGKMVVTSASVDLTGQTAAITATTALAVPSSGVGRYLVTFVAKVTTAGSISSVLGGTNGFQIKYTDANDSVVVTTGAIANDSGLATNLNTTQAVYAGSMMVNAKASTNIQYLMDYTSAGTAMAFNLHIKIVAL